MRVSSISIGMGLALLVSCAPDLAANGAQRCEESVECGAGSVCYRGFCVVDDGTVGDAGEVALADAAAPSVTSAEHDAGITPAIEIRDASSAATDMSQQNDATAPQLGPTAPETPPQPMQPATSPPPPTQSTADAGPIVVDLPGNCTLAECCAEARASLPTADGDDGDDDESSSGPGPGAGPKEKAEPEPKPKKIKACGCADPGLLSGVLCGLLGPLGV